ncbi:hypothetical protein QUF74_06030 [Candidatus Halobeggiatoa sp. HSG11]|nr:hypothetical protein [Candidatus Halobeggiatoa sp. HSG11]
MLRLFLLLTIFTSAVQANSLDNPVNHPAIPLLDEAGQHVLNSNQPYSPKTSCGTSGCHDYDAITHSFHFETGRDEASDNFGDMRQLTQLVSPGYYGGYNCMGGSNPDILAKKNNATESDFADHGSAGLIMRCISCHSGGGWMEKDRNNRRYDSVDPSTVNPLDGDYYNRGTDSNNDKAASSVVSQWDWKKSGVVENDCFLCHYRFDDLKNSQLPPDTNAYDHFRDVRRYDLVRKGFFRYVPSAILEVMTSQATDGSEHSLLNFARDDNGLQHDDNGKPILNWNPAAFDENKKAVIPMLRYPNNDNCMMCHRTSNSRRGFYGFGEKTAMETDAEGIYEEDYQDDVHYGKTWTEPNGETRDIKNCNACHIESYYRPSFSNVDLDSPHQFQKGNSDMDVRNDLDYHPAPKSCAYCHEEAQNPSIPSGHDTLLNAHKELWKASGDMSGYSSNSLDRVTKTHFDVISCEACHITNKKSRGRDIQIMYRYRRSEDGRLRIVPYNPRQRYYWKDKNTGYMLNQTERNSVFKLETDENGNKYGSLINPTNNALLGTVGARMSHGSWRFSDPDNYDGFMALKSAYDAVLAAKGMANPNAVMVWTESNYYVMSHNTRLAVDSLQCEDCHERKQNGSFSALISPNSVLGASSFKQLTKLPDRRLVDEGIVILDKPSMQLHDDGTVTQNMDDILYESKVNPSMSVLNTARADVIVGSMRRYEFANGIKIAELGSYSNEMNSHLFTPELYIFKPDAGDDSLRRIAVLMELNSTNESVFATAQIQAILGDNNIIDNAVKSGNGGLVSSVFNLQASYANGQQLTQLPAGGQMLVKLPFDYSNAERDNINLLASTDGKRWSVINSNNIVFVQAQTDIEAGYVLFWSDKFTYFTVANKAVAASVTSSSSGSSGGGGGSVFYLPMLLLLWLGMRYLREK